jgi:hypothetical protein
MTPAPSKNRYETSWESYWQNFTGVPTEVFWGCDPADAAAKDVKIFAPLADTRLPLVDFGCGHGSQTRCLADHFPNVIGVDVAPAAIEKARQMNAAPNLSYRVLDALDPQGAAHLHAEIGDANVYMRTVMHQLDPADQITAAARVAELMGATGALYLIELAATAEAYFATLAAAGLPPALARVFQHGIRPGLMQEKSIDRLFPAPEFETVVRGDAWIQTTHIMPAGEPARVPAFYRVIRRAGARS